MTTDNIIALVFASALALSVLAVYISRRHDRIEVAHRDRLIAADHAARAAEPRPPAPFQPGAVVRLRSGGPAMTVEFCHMAHFDDAYHVSCVWSTSEGAGRADFDPAILDLVPPSPKDATLAAACAQQQAPSKVRA